MIGFCFVNNTEKQFSIKNKANSFSTHASDRLWELNWSHSVWLWYGQKLAKVSTKFSIYTEVKVVCQHFLSTVLGSCFPLFKILQNFPRLGHMQSDLLGLPGPGGFGTLPTNFPAYSHPTPPQQTMWKSVSAWNPLGYRAHKSSFINEISPMSFEVEICNFSTPDS